MYTNKYHKKQEYKWPSPILSDVWGAQLRWMWEVPCPDQEGGDSHPLLPRCHPDCDYYHEHALVHIHCSWPWLIPWFCYLNFFCFTFRNELSASSWSKPERFDRTIQGNNISVIFIFIHNNFYYCNKHDKCFLKWNTFWI